MQITLFKKSPTKVELTISADQAFLDKVKDHVLTDLAKTVNMAGFRKGHAPKNLVEKNVDPDTLQSQFLDHAINDMYVEAVGEKKLRPVAQPAVTLSKFVPYTTLEIKAEVEVVGKISLPDYKAIRMELKVEKTTDADVDIVLNDLRRRDSAKKDVTRAAQDGDELTINFTGVDTATKEAIPGAAGSDYPLVLGSGTFIPGFEPELIGLKKGADKTFDITFPKDYGTVELQNKKVTFTVKAVAVKEFDLPKADNTFAATVGPFKTIDELKNDIRQQLQEEKRTQAQRKLENDLLASIAEKAKADIPAVLIDEEIDRMEEEEKRNLVYRGQTWQEHLEAEGKTDVTHREGLRESAEARVKTGLVLGEVAEAEQINVSEAELTSRISQLKKQYTDKEMQAELDKPENRREIASRIVTEKTIEKLVGYAQA